MATIAFLQVNLQHSKGASDVLNRTFTSKNLDFVLIQEPYVYRGLVSRLATPSGRLMYNKGTETPRAALLVRPTVKCILLTQFLSRDMVAVIAVVPTTGGKQEVVVASAYFPGDSEEAPPIEVRSLIKYCEESNKQLILGCDANAHHLAWGSTDTNTRGENLYEFISSTNLDIVNRGNEPTFVTRIRQEVLDITLASPLLSATLKNWYVSREASLSDHKHIRFDLEVTRKHNEQVRVPKMTDWCLYEGHIRSEVDELKTEVETVEDLEIASTVLHNVIHNAYEASCPMKSRRVTRKVPW